MLRVTVMVCVPGPASVSVSVFAASELVSVPLSRERTATLVHKQPMFVLALVLSGLVAVFVLAVFVNLMLLVLQD